MRSFTEDWGFLDSLIFWKNSVKLRLKNDKAEVFRTRKDFLIDFLILFLRFVRGGGLCMYHWEVIFFFLYINANANIIVLIYLYLIYFYICQILYSVNSLIHFLFSILYFIRYFFPPAGRNSSEETFITDSCRKYSWIVSCVVFLFLLIFWLILFFMKKLFPRQNLPCRPSFSYNWLLC